MYRAPTKDLRKPRLLRVSYCFSDLRTAGLRFSGTATGSRRSGAER
jgi:hypothetical protein